MLRDALAAPCAHDDGQSDHEEGPGDGWQSQGATRAPEADVSRFLRACAWLSLRVAIERAQRVGPLLFGKLELPQLRDAEVPIGAGGVRGEVTHLVCV